MPIVELTDSHCHYQIQGSGVPLLLIPGLGGDISSWNPLADLLAEHFTVICPDNRGLGRSTAKRRPRRIRDYAADLLELLDHLQISRAHVMGLSLGGVIAQRFAVDHPQRVARLIIVSSTQHFGPYLREVVGAIGRGIRFPGSASLRHTLELLSVSPRHIDANPTWLRDKLKSQPRSLAAGRAILQQLRVLGVSRFEPGEYHIQSPSLVIAGEFDALIPHCYAQQMAQMIPDSRFVLLPGVGHNPIAECPQDILPLVQNFLQNKPIHPPHATTRTTAHCVPQQIAAAPLALGDPT